MKWHDWIVLLLFAYPLYGADEEARRVDAHLLIGDTQSALKEASANLQKYPEDYLTHFLWIKSLARLGDAEKMAEGWEVLAKKFPEQAYKREVIEEMCLGILKKGCESDSLVPRLIALLAIARTELPEAVAIIKKACHDTNAHLRGLAVKLAAAYKDAHLQEEILRLFRVEKSREVRKEILSAMMALKMDSELPALRKLLEDKSRSSLEKKLLVLTIASLEKKITREDLDKLVQSGRMGEALLACELIVKLELPEQSDLLLKLTSNRHPEVRAAALKSLGIVRQGEAAIIEKSCRDNDPLIGITACWVVGLLEPSTIEKSFSYWLAKESSQVRALAASALATLHQSALPLLKKFEAEERDPWVKVNVAIHLLRQRLDTQMQAAELFAFLHQNKEKLMWEERGFFKILQKSSHLHTPLIPNYPEAANQAVRLELLNLLAIVEYPQAEAALREFLKESRWELVGLAAESLLQEGDESALDLIKKLLQDKEKETRFQAALALAVWGNDPDAIDTLLALYNEKDRAIKIKILEALGLVGEERVIPFLVDKLKEPSETLRLVAASSLIRLLYH